MNKLESTKMSEKSQLIYRWVKVGIVCGILADLCYGLAIGLPMPERLTNIVFFAFGPLLMAGAPGTYFFTIMKISVTFLPFPLTIFH